MSVAQPTWSPSASAGAAGSVAAEGTEVSHESEDRRPDIEIAAQLGILSAKPWIRSLAFVVDLFVWSILASPALIGGWFVLEYGLGFWSLVLIISGGVLATAFSVVQLALHGRRGVTLGKAAMRLRTVSVPGLARPGFWRMVLRALVLWCSGVLPIAGPVLLFSSSYWDSSGRQRSLLDRVGRCWLIDVKDGLDPTDVNALRRARRGYDARFRDISEHLPSLATARAGSAGSTAAGVTAATTEAVAGSPAIDLRAARSAASVIGAARERWETQRDRADGETTDSGRANVIWMFGFDDGTWVTVTSFGLIGRAPQQLAGRAIGQLIELADTYRMLADTHLAFGADEYGVWVEDLGSAGGSEVLEPGQKQTSRLAPGAPTRVSEGAIVELGGRGFRVRREELRA